MFCSRAVLCPNLTLVPPLLHTHTLLSGNFRWAIESEFQISHSLGFLSLRRVWTGHFLTSCTFYSLLLCALLILNTSSLSPLFPTLILLRLTNSFLPSCILRVSSVSTWIEARVCCAIQSFDIQNCLTVTV